MKILVRSGNFSSLSRSRFQRKTAFRAGKTLFVMILVRSGNLSGSSRSRFQRKTAFGAGKTSICENSGLVW